MKFVDIRRNLLLLLYERRAFTKQTAVEDVGTDAGFSGADPVRIELVLGDLEKAGLVGRDGANRQYLTVSGACESEQLSQGDPSPEMAGKGHRIALLSLIASVYVALIAFLPSSLTEAFNNGCGHLRAYGLRKDASFYCEFLRGESNEPGAVEGVLTSFWFWLIFLGLTATVIVVFFVFPRKANR